jgi:S-DNA-T family DNA segregation ATPase FtsK/SpoIIIE
MVKRANKSKKKDSPAKSDKSRSILGIIALFISLTFFVSLISYLFTWQEDQDKLMLSFSELFNPELQLTNWMGKIGAIIGHFFIYEWFGIASFGLCYILLNIGLKLLFNFYITPIRKTLVRASFLIIWFSTFLNFVFPESLLIMGGSFGQVCNEWLGSLLGQIGTLFILLTSALVYLILTIPNLKLNLQRLSKSKEIIDNTESKKKPKQAVIEPIKETSLVEELDDGFEIQTTTVQAKIKDQKEDKNANLPLDLDKVSEKKVQTSETKIPKEDEELELSIEIKSEDEQEVKESAIPDLGEYDPTLDLGHYQGPTIDQLKDYGDADKEISINRDELEENKNRIVQTLKNYNILISKIKATIGPTVTLYEIVPAPGVRISKIKNLEDDIALSLSALGIRIIAPIPGKGTVGIEVPNTDPEIVGMRTVIASEKFQKTKFDLPLALGKTISNETFITDLAKMPHLLMAGATGQGKSVGLNAILVSLLYKKHPSQIKFVLVDPKKVELTLFNRIERHYLAKLPDSEEAIITDTKKVIHTLNSLCIEMDQRYELLKNAEVRNLKEYNAKFIKRKLNPEKGHKFLPYIILVVDEFADLIMTAGKEVEQPIARLAQLARAIGIHLIIATQRPSVNIITGTIKANFPTRIAFRVTSKVDSRTILDSGGAEQLIGRGDMLLATGSDIIRLQCAFVDTPEVESVTSYIGGQRGYPEAFLLPEFVGDDDSNKKDLKLEDRDQLFDEAAKIIVLHQQGSASLLQRKLKLGYNRAGRIVDQLEAAGIIGPFEGSKARKVLIPDEHSLEQFLSNVSND